MLQTLKKVLRRSRFGLFVAGLVGAQALAAAPLALAKAIHSSLTATILPSKSSNAMRHGVEASVSRGSAGRDEEGPSKEILLGGRSLNTGIFMATSLTTTELDCPNSFYYFRSI